MPKVEQTLRPQDVLDVIFHISTSGSDAYRVQSGRPDRAELHRRQPVQRQPVGAARWHHRTAGRQHLGENRRA